MVIHSNQQLSGPERIPHRGRFFPGRPSIYFFISQQDELFPPPQTPNSSFPQMPQSGAHERMIIAKIAISG
jgi:hypothetical protein